MEQHLSSQQQNKWLTKMLGYDYEIVYKKGQANVVANALYKQFEEDDALLSLSLSIPYWIEEAHNKLFTHPSLS